jgi:hypothetical protein
MPRDRLFLAVEALAASSEPIQHRLARAGLLLVHLHPDEFEAEDRGELEAIRAGLSAIAPDDGASAIEVTTAAMSDELAVEFARRIVALDVAYRPLWSDAVV